MIEILTVKGAGLLGVTITGHLIISDG